MLDAIVVGAGHSGLTLSYHLSALGLEHVVLERGGVGESWRSGRWDTFALNTPNWYSLLPGDTNGLGPGDGFVQRDAFAAYLEGYAQRRRLPVRTGVAVTSVDASGDLFRVRTDATDPLDARAVVFAAGSQRVPRIPHFARSLPESVAQLHAVTYRSPDDLPAGAVLVVGSGQSGGQIAEDLLDAGRTVYLATSRVGRLRRRYRGRDCFEWLIEMKYFEQTAAQLPNPAMQFAPQPLISGVGSHGHSVSLQWLAGRGAVLLGRIEDVRDGALIVRDDVAANVRWGDERAADFRRSVDTWLTESGLEAGSIEEDEADEPHPEANGLHCPERLDLERAGISAVIWTTGVSGDYDWLPRGAIGDDGRPVHEQGASSLPGLYFLGLPWLRNRASGIIGGSNSDSAVLAAAIRKRSEGFAKPVA